MNNKYWVLKRESDKYKYYVNTELYCRDGDSATMYFDLENNFCEIHFLSGIPGATHIYVDQLDVDGFGKLIDLKDKSFEEKCFAIADYFCNMFCNRL